MTLELTCLALAVLLHLGLVVAFSIKANGELGTRYPLSPRDDAPPKPLSVVCGRLQRAMNNSFEGLTLFAPVVLIVVVSEQSTVVTQAAAVIWLLSRALYIPAYLMGLVPWRSLIWGIGFFAIAVLALAALI